MAPLSGITRPRFARPRFAQLKDRKWSFDLVSLASGLLPVLDVLCVYVAASVTSWLYSAWLAPGGLPFTGWSGNELTALAATGLLAAVSLYDPDFGTRASRNQAAALVHRFGLGFGLFTAAALVIAYASRALDSLPVSWLALYFGGTLLLTAVARLLFASTIRVLEHQGPLTEVIAVVGAGPLADRLVRHLRQTRGDRVAILGVFDDQPTGPHPHGAPLDHIVAGTVDDLLALGTTRPIDWILVALPCTAEHPLDALVQRLKALSAPIGLCPQNFGLTLPGRTIDFVVDGVPITPLADWPIRRWKAIARSTELLLPAWLAALLHTRHATVPASVVVAFDPYDTAAFARVAARFDADRYDYVVTPNADHLIRLHEDASFRALYATAGYVLLDSRFLARLLRATRGLELPVCTGSDLTATLFAEVISADDALVLIGGTPAQAAQLAERHGLRQLAHLNPPMGFIRDPVAVEACLRFVEANSPFRFCLLALGSPQQEIIAQRLKARGIACGLALCVGASIDFLTGNEQRAPGWVQRASLEWLFRLAQDPRRMASRYLVRGPRVFGLLRRTGIVLRPAALPRPIPRPIPLPALRAATSLLVPVQTGARAHDDTCRHDSDTAAANITYLDPGSRHTRPDEAGVHRPLERTVRLRGRERERIQPGAG